MREQSASWEALRMSNNLNYITGEIVEESKNKYSKWVFTLMEGGKYETIPSSSQLGEALEHISDKFVFQLETCPTTGRKHYQGCFITRIRKRHRTVLIELAVELSLELTQLTLDRMQGTWEQAAEYCSKEESREGGRTYLSKTLQEEEMTKYKGNDLNVFRTEGFYQWQQSLNDLIFESDSNLIKAASNRQVYWIHDSRGNSGKSLFSKFLCYNNSNITKLPFGSGSQMRASIVEEGQKQCYLIDIPRTLCNDDFQNNIYSVIEDLKNGFIKSSMYGKPKTLFMEPPVVIIFSNNDCPMEKLSLDRWKIFHIINNKLMELKDERLFD